MRLISLLTLLSTLYSCGMVERRSYSKIMQKKDMSVYTPGQEFKVAIGDSGKQYKTQEEIMAQTPDDVVEKEMYLERKSLGRELAATLGIQSQLQYEHYSRYEHELGSISEKLYFLRLETLEERDQYLSVKGIIAPDTSLQEKSAFNSDSGSIFWGMDKVKVMEVLGQPRQVDYAGDPRYENERWGYATNDLGTTRYIYFENGKVDGWEHVEGY